MKVNEELEREQQEYITDDQASLLVIAFACAVLIIVGLPSLLL
ncbi:hypothetical protein [Agromyces sp. NPDC058064]